MTALAIVTLVAEIVKEGASLIGTAVSASQEELAQLEKRCKDGLAALRGTRVEVEKNIDARHADAEKKLSEP